MPVASLLRLVAVALVLPLAGARAASPSPAVVAVIEGVSFVTEDGRLTVRVEATARLRSFAVERRGRTVTLVLDGAHVSPSIRRGRAEAPVRDYRVEGAGERVTVTFDAPAETVPMASLDDADVLLSFGSPLLASGAPSAVSPSRAAAWGGVSVPRTDPATIPEPTRRTAPRRRTRRAPTAVQTVRQPSAPVASSAPTPRIPAPSTAATAGPAPSASAWGTAPAVAIPDEPQATDAGTGDLWKLDTIVLDAGHGGHEPGGVGLYGVTDARVALGVVMRLGPRIERELGIRVVYTRQTDRFVKLEDRGPIANRSGAKLFVSVHGNVGPPSARGTETFFLAPRGSASARDVMMRENEIVRRESDPSLYAAPANETDIIAALAMSAYQEESQFLAGLVEREFVSQGRHSRGVKQDNFQVLRETSMPAILVETGFVSNPDEARYLQSARGLDEVADALFRAIRAYKEHYESGLRLAAR